MKFLLFLVSCFVAVYASNVVYVEVPLRENIVISAEEPEYLNDRRNASSSSSSRVVGGQNAPRGMFNYMVRLHMLVPGGIILCGGSLISATHIVTADHCIPGGQLNGIEAHLGVTQWNGPDHRVAQVRYIVRRGQATDPFVDLAIYILSGPVAFSDTIAPVGMPRHGQANDNFVGRTGWIPGWGGVNDGWLKFIPIRYVTQGNCGTANRMLCAAGRDNFNQNVIGGDSGGPIVIQTGAFHTLVGCVSFMYNRHIGGTHIPLFLRWISDATGIIFQQ